MSDTRSRTGDAPGDEGPQGSVSDPAAHTGGEDSTTTIVSGGSGGQGTAAAASEEVADDDGEPTRSE